MGEDVGAKGADPYMGDFEGLVVGLDDGASVGDVEGLFVGFADEVGDEVVGLDDGDCVVGLFVIPCKVSVVITPVLSGSRNVESPSSQDFEKRPNQSGRLLPQAALPPLSCPITRRFLSKRGAPEEPFERRVDNNIKLDINNL